MTARIPPPEASLAKDYWPAVQSMISADIGSKSELILRYLVVGLGAIFMTIVTQGPVIGLWLAAFLLTNGYYSWWLSRVAPPIKQRTYFALVSLLVASVTLYTSCAVYLFTLESTSMKTIAVAALAAQSIFNLSRHRHSTFTAVYDTAIVAAAGLFFGLSSLAAPNQTVADQMIIIVSTLGVCSYYTIAQYRNIIVNRKLEQAQLETIQTQKMRAVGQLTAGIAHDFNNLLTVIRGNVELAELAEDDHERAALLDEAKTASSRAGKLISQLLSFSRKARLQTTVVKLDGFWRDSGSFFSSVIPATVKIEKDVDPSLESIVCDRNQLENAIMNLIVNAADAMAGVGTLRLESRPCPPALLDEAGLANAANRKFGIIAVRDTGPGIPSELLSSVTEPFFTTKAVGKGSGLGLSMVKGFTEQSGGELIIRSDGLGTSVMMVLPAEMP